MDELPLELNIITLNCWGLLHLSPHRAKRLTAIGRYLATSEPSPHIVSLQECWTQEDYRSIRRETRFVLPFGKFYHSGAFGSGLVILSKWPIEESSMFRFPLNGRPTAFFRGDWFAGKGVACARIRYGDGEKDVVEVFNTHTHPVYQKAPSNNSYTVHRLSQAWELAKLLRGATERGHLVVALGDLNDVPLSLPYRLLSAHSPIRDAWRVLYPDSSLGSAEHEVERSRRRPIPTAAFNVAENGVTSRSAYNTWSWPRSTLKELRSGKRPMLGPDAPDAQGQRIDYIFFSRGGNPSLISELSEILSSYDADEGGGGRSAALSAPPGWVVRDVRVGAMARDEDLECSLSDHFSVEATLLLHTPTANYYKKGANATKRYLRDRDRDADNRQGTDGVNTNPNEGGGHHPTTPAPNLPELDGDHSLHPAASFTSTEAGIRTIGERRAAMAQGTYLQSPTASEYRNSRDRADYDDQLRSFDDNSNSNSYSYSYSYTSDPYYATIDGPTNGSGGANANGLLPSGTYDEILSLIHTYQHREHTQKKWRAAHCAAWIAVVVPACLVAVWFVAPLSAGGAFALLLLSSLGLAAGLVDGLLALLFFGGAERAALAEFEWEIRNAKATATGSHGMTLMGDEDDEKRW
ncbi:Uu.00g038350.m01.CDS01 [Anthostomella pinea]|uniref:Uu.00g038350.m01.CDS01 n=1 Tax=Anthostomella pinea TaxID=933095 RepID=A0AAI8VAG0_9PEZI|nr:Uu.00g038350.m01.CDS01 [Anthostomella pinea]